MSSKNDSCTQILATSETGFNGSGAVDLVESETLDGIPLAIHLGSNNEELIVEET